MNCSISVWTLKTIWTRQIRMFEQVSRWWFIRDLYFKKNNSKLVQTFIHICSVKNSLERKWLVDEVFGYAQAARWQQQGSPLTLRLAEQSDVSLSLIDHKSFYKRTIRSRDQLTSSLFLWGEDYKDSLWCGNVLRGRRRMKVTNSESSVIWGQNSWSWKRKMHREKKACPRQNLNPWKLISQYWWQDSR